MSVVPEASTSTSTSTSASRGAPALRDVDWRDLATLTRLDRDLFGDDAWSEATWWAELAARPRRDYVVLDDSGPLAGYAGLDLVGAVADVMTIAVAPAYRGRGLGHHLVRALLERARRRGAEAVMLEVRADNDGARSLYAAHGFELLSIRRRYYQPGDVDAHVLRRLVED